MNTTARLIIITMFTFHMIFLHPMLIQTITPELPFQEFPVSSPYNLSWKHDGTTIASSHFEFSAKKYLIKLFDVQTGKETTQLENNNATFPLCAHFSKNNALLAGYNKDADCVDIWDTNTGKVIRSIKVEPPSFMQAYWNPDGTKFALNYCDPIKTRKKINVYTLEGNLEWSSRHEGGAIDWSKKNQIFYKPSKRDHLIIINPNNREQTIENDVGGQYGHIRCSPSGEKIALEYNFSDPSILTILNIQKTTKTKFTTPLQASHISWSHDEKYASMDNWVSSSNQVSITSINVHTGDRFELSFDGDCEDFEWSPNDHVLARANKHKNRLIIYNMSSLYNHDN